MNLAVRRFVPLVAALLGLSSYIIMTINAIQMVECMRLKALVSNHNQYKKAIIYAASSAGVYLFLYDTQADASCIADYWCESIEDAQETACELAGIAPDAWHVIADPLPGAQHDWERPTRAVTSTTGKVSFVPFDEDLQAPPSA
ncbi:MAG: hypothetical protein M3R24_02095 [Chloroflexota bacterium]|nr:hypothetical protein [Chloroflexota bacterium]